LPTSIESTSPIGTSLRSSFGFSVTAPPALKIARIIPLSNNASLVQVAVARPYLALACKYFQEFIGFSAYLNGWSAGG
jgi:hypothetical protein